MATSIITIEDGCYVIYRQPLVKGNAYIEIGYASTITLEKGTQESITILVNKQGMVLEQGISLKCLWHIGKDHSKCKKHGR